MKKISVDINNGEVLELAQYIHDGEITLCNGRDKFGNLKNEYKMTAGELVMLLNILSNGGSMTETKTKKKNLYTESCEPKRIRCYMQKKPTSIDYITVVFTYASRLGYSNGTVLYRAMNGNPYHPACGYCQWGEGRDTLNYQKIVKRSLEGIIKNYGKTTSN